MTQDKWEQFCEKAAQTLRDAFANKIKLSEASEFFETDTSISDPDVRRYVESMVWEIGGSPDAYQELIKLFEARVPEEELVARLSAPKPLSTWWRSLFQWKK